MTRRRLALVAVAVVGLACVVANALSFLWEGSAFDATVQRLNPLLLIVITLGLVLARKELTSRDAAQSVRERGAPSA